MQRIYKANPPVYFTVGGVLINSKSYIVLALENFSDLFLITFECDSRTAVWWSLLHGIFKWPGKVSLHPPFPTFQTAPVPSILATHVQTERLHHPAVRASIQLKPELPAPANGVDGTTLSSYNRWKIKHRAQTCCRLPGINQNPHSPPDNKETIKVICFEVNLDIHAKA
jgi:hypothetical protein